MKVALYGGSFDPPHIGHLLVVSYVLATQDVDQLWLLPTYRHAFGKKMAPFEDRLEMCRILEAHFPSGVVTSSVESEVDSDRTVDTLEYLRRRHPEHDFRLVIGSDILGEAHRWKAFDRVKELAPLILVARGDHPSPEAEGPVMPAVSSTEVRRRLAAGEDAALLVPRKVLAYVESRGLYRDSSSDA